MSVTTAVRRVLLADDTPEIRALVRMALEIEGGFEVVAEASDGAEALHLAGDHHPDIVVIDLAMPVMDGLEAIPEIRARIPSTKILVLSGFDAAQMKKEAMTAGADAYLEKGEAAHRLVALLNELCPEPGEAGAHNGGPESGAASEPPRTEPGLGGVAAEKGSDVLTSLAHELMTPVTVVKGFADALVERAGDVPAATVKDWARTIGRNAAAMAGIIRSFRETARLESGTLDLQLRDVDLTALAAEVVDELRALAPTRRIDIVSGPAAVVVRADRVKVRQILVNLVSNAIKFSSPEGPIEITAEAGSFYGEMTVRDHGAGVPGERVPELFEKYSRLDAHQEGTGLGLYISRRLARAHGGDVVYADAQPGARFSLRLPLPR